MDCLFERKTGLEIESTYLCEKNSAGDLKSTNRMLIIDMYFYVFFFNCIWLISDSTKRARCPSKNDSLEPNEKRRKYEIKCDEHEENRTNGNQVALPDFVVGDIVWAKLRRHPFWPARIERIYGIRNQMLEIYWMNDYRRSKIYKSQIQSFLPNFRTHSALFDAHVGLETAAKEAMLYLANKLNK